MSFAVYSVKTDMLTSGAISRLYIANANRHDSGNYTCGMLQFCRLCNYSLSHHIFLIALADIAQSVVMVHVLIGKESKHPNSEITAFFI